jgi:hypothetical protein
LSGSVLPNGPELVAEREQRDGRICREYENQVLIGGALTRASAVVCRDTRGDWALAAATPRLTADTAASICPRPGTVVETSIGGYLRFTYGDGPRCWYRTRSGALDARYAAFLSGDSSWLEKGGSRLRDLFPLEIGKEVWFIVDGVTSSGYATSWDETYTVVGRERIRVPAGTFDTYVIRWMEWGRLTNDWEATHTFWYAPAVGYFVKFRAAWHTGMKSWEATRIELQSDPLLASQPPDAIEGSGSSGPPRPQKKPSPPQ